MPSKAGLQTQVLAANFSLMPSISFIDRYKVIRALIKERCKLADKQAEADQRNEFVCRADVKLRGNRRLEMKIYKMFPPRREWCGLGRIRKELDSVKRNELKLWRTYLKAKRKNCKEEWYVGLCEYADRIVRIAITQDSAIPHPQVTVLEKKRDKRNKVIIYRPICTFPPETKIVFSLLNKRLTACLDDCFYDCSYAFRVKSGRYKLQHLNVIEAIRQYRMAHKGIPLYVAECDMKKFYDTIDHDIIKERFCKLLHMAVKKGNITADEAKLAKKWVFMYVDCFNFKEHVYGHNKRKPNDPFWKRRKRDDSWSCRIDWVDELAKKKGHSKYGVPQGGSLSGLIANVVMHSIDKAVMDSIGSDDVLYCRFCDDMVLIGTNREKVSAVFGVYQRAIRSSKLFAHPNEMNVLKAKDFWEGKTRDPYEWSEKGKNVYPWITFVGFDINWKGNLRIRRPSFKKHLTKQHNTAYELMRPYRQGKRPRYCAETIKSSLVSRLNCMSVGRVNLWNYMGFHNNCSWMNAFSILDENKWSVAQMKALDRHENAVVKRTIEELGKFDCPAAKKKDDNSTGEEYRFIFRGSPYSYHGQCFVYKRSDLNYPS